MADEKNTQEEEHPNIYIYPDNYQNSGRMFNGMIESRNFIEAVIVVACLGFLEWIFLNKLETVQMIAIMIITIGPLFIVALVGINGDSLSQFLMSLITFMKNKRKLRYRRIMKNASTTGSRAKTRPTNSKKKTSRATTKK